MRTSVTRITQLLKPRQLVKLCAHGVFTPSGWAGRCMSSVVGARAVPHLLSLESLEGPASSHPIGHFLNRGIYRLGLFLAGAARKRTRRPLALPVAPRSCVEFLNSTTNFSLTRATLIQHHSRGRRLVSMSSAFGVSAGSGGERRKSKGKEKAKKDKAKKSKKSKKSIEHAAGGVSSRGGDAGPAVAASEDGLSDAYSLITQAEKLVLVGLRLTHECRALPRHHVTDLVAFSGPNHVGPRSFGSGSSHAPWCSGVAKQC